MTTYNRVRVATVNDDFTDRQTNLPLVARVADVMLTQENKHDDVRRLLPEGWLSWQDLSSASTRGSAVCWLPEVFRRGSSDQRIAARGRGILPRRLTVVHGRVGKAPVTFIACHRPLKRTGLQRAFDRVLALYCTLLRWRRRFVVIGLDANERQPNRLAHRCGLRWVAPNRRSIDGLLISPAIRPRPAKALPKWTSDHHPVLVYLDIPNRSRL